MSDGLYGVDLRTLRGSILPDSLSVGIHLGHTILMSHQYVAVGFPGFARRPVAFHQHSITDFASFQLVLIAPLHFTVLHDKHATLLALSRIEKVMPCQIRVNILSHHALWQKHQGQKQYRFPHSCND